MTLDLAKLKEAAEKALPHPFKGVDTTAERMLAAEADAETILALIERLESAEVALQWYGAAAKNCRKLTPEGQNARLDLDQDGGARARAHMENHATPGEIPVLKPFIKPDSFTIEELEEAIKRVRGEKESSNE